MSKLLIQKNPSKFKESLAKGESKKIVLIYSEDPSESQIENVFDISSANSDLELLLLFAGQGHSKFNIKLQVRHLAPSSRSRITLKAILGEESALNCTGNVFVSGEARKTDTYLQCESLLLSEKAKVKAIPSLEIIASDIKAGHSASIGRVDDEQLFYLLARGFHLEKARKMLVEAFLLDTVNSFTDLSDSDIDLLKTELMEIIPST
jgi:Fe-S cluster assembly protein SufD